MNSCSFMRLFGDLPHFPISPCLLSVSRSAVEITPMDTLLAAYHG